MKCNYCRAEITHTTFVVNKYGTYCDKICARGNDPKESLRISLDEMRRGETHDIETLWDDVEIKDES